MGRAQEIPGCSYPGLLLKADPRIYCIPKLCSPGDHQARIPRLCSPVGGGGSPAWGQTADLKERPQYKESQPWQASTWPLPPPISEQRGRLFAASQGIRKGPKGAGSHILGGSCHCISGVNSPGVNMDHRM